MTPNDISDEFIDLFESLQEGSLDAAGHERFEELVRRDPALLEVVRHQFGVSRALADLERPDDGFAERAAFHILKMAGEGEDEFSRKFARRILRRRMAIVLAVAALVMLALMPMFFRPADSGPAAAPVVATLVRLDGDGGIVATEEVVAGTRYHETDGLVRLAFPNGAMMAVEGPANFTVHSEMEMTLDSGTLNGWCPESAHGFVVRTASASLRDLGTSFGISAAEDGTARFMVLDGSVEVANLDEKLLLEEGDAVAAKTGVPLRSVIFDPSAFGRTWALSHGILATRGAVVPANPDVPERLIHVEDDNFVLVIPERREVSFVQPIHAEITGPGTLPGDFDGEIHILQPRPERRLSSFLIRYNPVGTFPEDYFVEFEGEVTFDRPVVAIACQLQALKQTDAAFATGEWPEHFRGIELMQLNNQSDTVTLSEDRRTVKVRFFAGASTDEVRVILEDR